jgi:C4-type Zn-finger protein
MINISDLQEKIICPICNSTCKCEEGGIKIFHSGSYQISFFYKNYYSFASILIDQIILHDISPIGYGLHINVAKTLYVVNETNEYLIKEINDHFSMVKKYMDNIIFT